MGKTEQMKILEYLDYIFPDPNPDPDSAEPISPDIFSDPDISDAEERDALIM